VASIFGSMDSATDSDDDLIDAAVHMIFGPASPRSQGGSLPGRAPNINRSHEAHAASLLQDYFLPDCTYGEDHFRRRFRMSRPLFVHIMDTVCATDSYFVQSQDATGIY